MIPKRHSAPVFPQPHVSPGCRRPVTPRRQRLVPCPRPACAAPALCHLGLPLVPQQLQLPLRRLGRHGPRWPRPLLQAPPPRFRLRREVTAMAAVVRWRRAGGERGPGQCLPLLPGGKEGKRGALPAAGKWGRKKRKEQGCRWEGGMDGAGYCC